MTSEDFSLLLPDIDHNIDYFPVTGADNEDTILSDLVRKHYLTFIENLLSKNYEEWYSKASNSNIKFTAKEIRSVAEKLELQAVKSSAIVRLYRPLILNIISEIKQETKSAEIHSKLIQLKFSPNEATHHDIGIQTNPEVRAAPKKRSRNASVSTTSVLDQKIRTFEQNVLQQNLKKVKVHKPLAEKPFCVPSTTTMFSPPQPLRFQHAVTSSSIDLTPSPKMLTTPEPVIPPRPPKDHEEDDKILKELASMFDDDDGKTSLQEIFEDCANPQIDQIMHEIENYDDRPAKEAPPKTGPAHSPKMTVQTEISEVEREQQRQKDIEHKLKNSIWPCELHMQTMRLRETMSRIAEEDLYKFEIVKVRFEQLFEDDDTEELLAPYSPTIELNAILLSSCRTRISRWVVNGLMKPLNQKLIANRFLFKKLAKQIADNIIYVNQYPDEKYIRKYIEDYFCTHSAINDVDDIT